MHSWNLSTLKNLLGYPKILEAPCEGDLAKTSSATLD